MENILEIKNLCKNLFETSLTLERINASVTYIA